MSETPYFINTKYLTYPLTTNSSHIHTFDPAWNAATIVWNGTDDTAKIYPSKEQTMTTLDKVRAERREAFERKRIEQAYADFDSLGLADTPEGSVITFCWVTPKQEYTYAALFVNDHWYVTGRESPNGLGTEDFVAWLIGKEITPGDLTFLGVEE